MEDNAGAESEGETVSEVGCPGSYFRRFRCWARKFNDTLADAVTRWPPQHFPGDRMVAARFEVPAIEDRGSGNAWWWRIEEIDGKVFRSVGEVGRKWGRPIVFRGLPTSPNRVWLTRRQKKRSSVPQSPRSTGVVRVERHL